MVKKLKGFSLVDALIILVVIAVVIVLSTPVITKKSINIADIGASLSGSMHGKIEAYRKEIVKFSDYSHWLEKISNPSTSTTVETITIYERKTDAEHIEYVYDNAANAAEKIKIKDGKKPILYEEYPNAIPVVDTSGAINSFKFKKDDTKIIPIGGKYIAEAKGIEYLHTGADGQRTSGKLDTSKNRIIEGNFAKILDKKSPAPKNNNLWLVNIDTSGVDYTTSEDSNKVVTIQKNGTILKSIPWYRVYSGEKVKKDEPIGADSLEFDLPQNLKSVRFYGVGGGGRGAEVTSTQAEEGTFFLNSATNEDINKIATDLVARFKEVYTEKYNSVTDTAHKDQIRTLVCGTKNDAQCFSVSNLVFIHDGNKEVVEKPVSDSSAPFNKHYWISINKGDGTISAKFDARTGLVFPHELLKYTKNVGSQTQVATTYHMPEWFNWETLNNNYCIAASACGTEGEDAPDFVWYTKKGKWENPPNQGNYECFKRTFANNGRLVNKTITDISKSQNFWEPDVWGCNYAGMFQNHPWCCNKLDGKSFTIERNILVYPVCDKSNFIRDGMKCVCDKGFHPSGVGPKTICVKDSALTQTSRASKIDLRKNYDGEVKETLAYKIKKNFKKWKGVPTGYAGGAENNRVTPENTYTGNQEIITWNMYLQNQGIELTCDNKQSCCEKENTVAGCKSKGLDYVHIKYVDTKEPIAGGYMLTRVPQYQRCEECMACWNKTAIQALCTYPRCEFYTCPLPGIASSVDAKGFEQIRVDCANDICSCNLMQLEGTDRAAIPHYYPGGKGGTKPLCVVAQIGFSAATNNYTIPIRITYSENQDHICENKCDGLDYKMFGNNESFHKASGNFSVYCEKFGGDSGITRSATISGYTASSVGGGGGKPYPYNIVSHTKGNKITEEQLKCLKEEITKLGHSYNDVSAGKPLDCDKNNKNCKYIPTSHGVANDIEFCYKNCGIEEDVGEYTNSCMSGTYQFDEELQCRAKTVADLPDEADVDGTDGYVDEPKDLCSHLYAGIGTLSQGREFNYAYVWSAPYVSNSLPYGEAGTPGEMDDTEVEKITGKITINLGRGATKNNIATDTTVYMQHAPGSDEILKAKAGKNGNIISKKTLRYDMCYKEPSATQTCKSIENDSVIVPCCNNENGAHITKEVISTSSKPSLFEIIKGLAGNSTIVGIGMGRSSAGYGVIAGLEALDALRTVKNISFGNGPGYSVSPSLDGVTASSNNKLNPNDYKNKVLIPPPFENKGGDGAVIITW